MSDSGLPPPRRRGRRKSGGGITRRAGGRFEVRVQIGTFASSSEAERALARALQLLAGEVPQAQEPDEAVRARMLAKIGYRE
jgi:hypothetical protein